MIRKQLHPREHYSKNQTNRPIRIIHVSIRTSKLAPSAKNNTLKDSHRLCSADDQTNPRSINSNSNSLHTFNRSDPISISIKTLSTASKSSTVNPLQMNDSWANPSDYSKKHNQNNNNTKKKKKKCIDRRYLIMILVALFILIAVITIIPVVLLTKSIPKAKYPSNTPILRWNQTGITVAGVAGQSGNSSDKLYNPRGVYLDWSYTLYVADTLNNRIQKYLRDASFGETVAGQASGIAGVGSSYLYQPADVLVDLNNNIYVTDTGNSRVQLWSSGSSTGNTIAGITGISGNSFNQLDGPYGIVHDSISNGIYVADYNNHRVMYFPANVLNGTVVAGGNGGGINRTQLNGPLGLNFDVQSNSLLIPNCFSNNVVQWILGASSWSLIAGYVNGSSSSTSTGFSCARDVLLDPMGNTYITDRDNQRIQFFPIGETSGITIAGITGISGSNASLLSTPTSIMLDGQLNLYVTDQNNHRVQKFIRY